MSLNWLTDFIPFFGDRTVRKRLQDLEEDAATLPKIFSFLIAAGIAEAAKTFPIISVGTLKIFGVAIIVGFFYVYDKNKRQELKEAAKDKAKEKTEEAKDKVKDDE